MIYVQCEFMPFQMNSDVRLFTREGKKKYVVLWLVETYFFCRSQVWVLVFYFEKTDSQIVSASIIVRDDGAQPQCCLGTPKQSLLRDNSIVHMQMIGVQSLDPADLGFQPVLPW